MLGDRVAATPVPSTATSNTTAADVLNQTVIALGGQAALDSITNITYQCDTYGNNSFPTEDSFWTSFLTYKTAFSEVAP